MLNLVAKELFLTRGIGVHEDKLTSFEYALRDAGISGTNIVLISSIFPPKAKLILKRKIKIGFLNIFFKNLYFKSPYIGCPLEYNCFLN